MAKHVMDRLSEFVKAETDHSKRIEAILEEAISKIVTSNTTRERTQDLIRDEYVRSEK